MPLVITLVGQSLALVSLELSQMLEALWVSRDQGSPGEERRMLLHAVSLSPFPGVRGGLLL